MDDFEQELKCDFLNEASDLLTQAEVSFMQLETDPENSTLIDAIFRFAHNLKGTSRAVGFGQIAELTHTAENLLLKIKQAEIKVTPPVVDILLKFNDKVLEMIEGLKENLEAQFDYTELLSSLEDVIKGNFNSIGAKEAEIVNELPAEEIETLEAPSASSFDEVENAHAHVEEVVETEETRPEPVILIQEKKKAVEPQVISKQETKPTTTATKVDAKKDDETIRVSLSRLESLGDLVGELVILQSVVERALLQNPAEAKTRRSLSKLCKDIQEISMSLRMVPVASAFQKLQRIVRDTSKVLGKKVDLHLLGEDTEIDRTVLEHLGDPLVHLVRNSVDHGIELPHDRLLDGKTENGVVEVMAKHEGNNLVIQITDDGHGMDPQKLIQKARQKGILREDQTVSDNEAFNLIFHPGFSTKEQVSEVSGRGVGMDVVKTNIEALGGEIKLQSKLGVGSCIRLMLPLTLAIIDGLLITSSGQRVVIPRNQIHEIIRINSDNIQMVGEKVPYYQLRDQVLPLLYLKNELGFTGGKETIVIIIKSSSIFYAVAVEDVLRQQQVVVKPPTLESQGRAGIMGTTILGDGMPALILDLLELYSKRGSKTRVA